MALAVHGVLLLAVLNTRSEPGPAPPPPMQVELTPAIAFEPPPPRAASKSPDAAPAAAAIPTAAPPPAPTRARAAPSDAVLQPRASPAIAAAPVVVEARTPSLAAPAPQPVMASAAPPPPSNDAALTSFQGRVMARLAQVKRYPPAARARREQGVAAVRFTLTGQGRVRTIALDRSSGSSLLDREALETVRRAQPLPRIPEELSDPLLLTVAVEFVLP